jgi:ketosteroid isomerase-like protein
MGGVGVPEEDNVERVRQAFEAIEREGWQALFPLIDPEFELTTPPELAMEPDTYHGTDGLRRYFESFEDAMKDIRIVPEGEFLAAGDKVYFPFRLSARGKETEIEAEQRAFQVWTMRDGKGLRPEVFATREAALDAAGLPPDG